MCVYIYICVCVYTYILSATNLSAGEGARQLRRHAAEPGAIERQQQPILLRFILI